MRKKKEKKIREKKNLSLLDIIELIGNSLLLNILFLIFSIPIVTVGPSASAFYFTMKHCVLEDNSYPAKTFWITFRRCFVKGLIFTVLILAVAVLFLVNRQYSAVTYKGREAVLMVAAYDVLILLLATFTVYIFPVLSRFNLKIKDLLKVTLTAVAKKLYIAVLLLAIYVIAGYLIIRMSVGFTLIIPALVCYIAVRLMEISFNAVIGDEK